MDNSNMVEWCAINEDPLNDHFFNIPIDDIDIGRESIPILELSTSFGRESLGILRLGCDADPSDYNFSLNNVSEFSPNNVLNQAFLLPSRRASEFKSASTYSMISSNFSLNLRELDQLSAIRNLDYTNSVQSKDSINTLNHAFLYSTEMDRFSLFPYRSRMYSLPVYTDKEHEFYKEQLIQQVKRVSEGCLELNSSVSKNNFNDEQCEYNDSVFLEAHYLSTKFSEGSTEDCILDETDPPALVSGIHEENECDHKNDKEEIFKKVDMLLPIDGYHKLNAKLNSCPSEISKHSNSPKLQTDEYKCDTAKKEKHESNDVIDLPDLRRSSSEAILSDVEKSKEILLTLSEIMAKDDRSEKETQQGQHLLHTLSDMLSNKSRERSKSFTNSSVKSFYGAEEMHENSTKPEDSSLKSNDSSKYNSSNRMLKRHSNSFSHATKTAMATSFEKKTNCDKSNNKSNMSNGSEPSIEMKNFGLKNPAANLRIKKMTSAPAKRGPMKATISIDNLIKSKQKGTPPKVQQKLSKLNPKISTPIRDVYIRPPVAQSTPDNDKIVNCSSSSIDQPNVKSFSSSIQEKSTITSGSGSSFSHKDSSISKDSSLQRFKFTRRNSISEDRKSSIPSLIKRSNSMKETSLMKTMNKIRMNISGSGALRDSSNIPAKDGGSKIYGKLLNSSRKITKSFGKENSSAVY